MQLSNGARVDTALPAAYQSLSRLLATEIYVQFHSDIGRSFGLQTRLLEMWSQWHGSIQIMTQQAD